MKRHEGTKYYVTGIAGKTRKLCGYKVLTDFAGSPASLAGNRILVDEYGHVTHSEYPRFSRADTEAWEDAKRHSEGQ